MTRGVTAGITLKSTYYYDAEVQKQANRDLRRVAEQDARLNLQDMVYGSVHRQLQEIRQLIWLLGTRSLYHQLAQYREEALARLEKLINELSPKVADAKEEKL